MKEERLFEYLKHKDSTPFSKDVIENWYKARAYVLEKLKDVLIGPACKEHLHVVVAGDSPLMLSVVRQVALSAHFPNYDETTGENRTVITIVSKSDGIVQELFKEEYLCNLPIHCKRTVGVVVTNPDSYIDIELEVVKDWKQCKDEKAIVMSEEDLENLLSNKPKDAIYGIDTRKAVLAKRMYAIGTLIDNIPAEDIHSANRYALALDVFQHKELKGPLTELVNEADWKKDLTIVKNGLSNDRANSPQAIPKTAPQRMSKG